ncbi:MAG: hypothetical protein COB03_08990 [Alteromonas sp.]|nr:MAG: hypothetical protein COB03_08990 [Alteromonas sp.]
MGACPGVYSKYLDALREIVNFQGADMLKYKSEE